MSNSTNVDKAKEVIYRLFDSFYSKHDGFQIMFASVLKELTKEGYDYATAQKALKLVCRDSLVDGLPYLVMSYENHNDETLIVVCSFIDFPIVGAE